MHVVQVNLQFVLPGRVVVFGGLKVGTKRLWVWPPGERAQTEVQATCVLDFYVHESIQRHGVGRQLFEVRIDVIPCECQGLYQNPCQTSLR